MDEKKVDLRMHRLVKEMLEATEDLTLEEFEYFETKFSIVWLSLGEQWRHRLLMQQHKDRNL